MANPMSSGIHGVAVIFSRAEPHGVEHSPVAPARTGHSIMAVSR